MHCRTRNRCGTDNQGEIEAIRTLLVHVREDTNTLGQIKAGQTDFTAEQKTIKQVEEGLNSLNGSLSEFRNVKPGVLVSPIRSETKNIATIQPGITGGELYSQLFKEGLTQVGGTCADVGISGLVLTGGMGPLIRKHGLTCDNLLSFEMVNADGEILQINSHNEHKDLFWAACGGGAGNFGILTSLTMKVYPADKVTWFNIGWDWNQPVEKCLGLQ